jgi:hypothetical protein
MSNPTDHLFALEILRLMLTQKRRAVSQLSDELKDAILPPKSKKHALSNAQEELRALSYAVEFLSAQNMQRLTVAQLDTQPESGSAFDEYQATRRSFGKLPAKLDTQPHSCPLCGETLPQSREHSCNRR